MDYDTIKGEILGLTPSDMELEYGVKHKVWSILEY